MALLFTMGFSDEAWLVFDQVTATLKKPQPWISAVIGGRVDKRSSEETLEWLRRASNTIAHSRKLSLLGRFALHEYFIDRMPDAMAIETIAEMETAHRRMFYRPASASNPEGSIRIRPAAIHKDSKLVRESGFLPDPERVYFARAYLALKHRDFETAYSVLFERGKYYQMLFDLTHRYVTPYYVWAALKSGNRNAVEVYLADRKKRGSSLANDFDFLLTYAVFHAGIGDHDNAIENLRAAFGVRPHTESRALIPWYQLLEFCEWIHDASGERKYIGIGLDWARRWQKIQPMYSWAHAFVAKYADDKDERQEALGKALYLDEHSTFIQETSDEARKAAREWFQRTEPFSPKDSDHLSNGRA